MGASLKAIVIVKCPAVANKATIPKNNTSLRLGVTQKAIANGANAFLFQIPIANYSAGEAILKMKAGTNETAIHKYLFCESGSGAVENNEYGTLGHAIGATITFEMTDGSGGAGSTHIGMKVANADGISITAKVEATFFSV